MRVWILQNRFKFLFLQLHALDFLYERLTLLDLSLLAERLGLLEVVVDLLVEVLDALDCVVAQLSRPLLELVIDRVGQRFWHWRLDSVVRLANTLIYLLN